MSDETSPAPDETPTEPLSQADIEAERQRQQRLTSPEEDGTRKIGQDYQPALTLRRSAQGFAAAALRDIGRVREANQDCALATIMTLPREGSDVAVGLFIVADGMGGHQGGEVASRLAVQTVFTSVLERLVLPVIEDGLIEALQPLMIEAVQEANAAIWREAQATGSDMGTTCTAALVIGNGLYIAHVGDSRCYVYEPAGLRLLTTDHSTVGRLIALGQLDPEEARDHPLRNQLYRTVGQQPQVAVDFVYHQLTNCSHLVLCSDGLWSLVEERAIEQALRHSPWPHDVCRELIALANLAGGDDNISAVVVSLPLDEA
ncbi:MAG: protein phosphatase [Chloroflexus sp.]|uniref:PP2C family protein-serine/threonine phosphatase n=1 Tax=Chloroflexus sp. TaxID=1904827 RepID=UPI0021DE2862|nr:protein phosphatase 2C domain-containing protein [Chloroflexus sp.]GIV86514.1 MAG: protein phosphatase [Chloroflexus sp.]GIV93236.1 MAG: protein phosphatase [Chloroflexus sp.]